MRGRVTRVNSTVSMEPTPLLKKLSSYGLLPRFWLLDPTVSGRLVTMSYQWDSRGDPFAARRTNNKLYVTTTVRQNGRRHRRERPLVWRWRINLRRINAIDWVVVGIIKICHIVIVDNSCEGRSISASKSVEKHALILHRKSYRLSIFLAEVSGIIAVAVLSG